VREKTKQNRLSGESFGNYRGRRFVDKVIWRRKVNKRWRIQLAVVWSPSLVELLACSVSLG
jgi:hypothetical protein